MFKTHRETSLFIYTENQLTDSYMTDILDVNRLTTNNKSYRAINVKLYRQLTES